MKTQYIPILEQNPKAKFGDISKIVSQLWEALGESEKAVYKKRNADDKIRFQREMEAYKAGLNVQQVEREEELQDEVTKEVFTSTGKCLLRNFLRALYLIILLEVFTPIRTSTCVIRGHPFTTWPIF